ncbi:MAG: hypothetical protein II272_04565 [Oscillospiraceae bacterium]|nr:hypothetical protein [Oscillospiraceae bacterium]
MTGKYEIKISNNRVSFTLILERNISIIRGDSATGKTTLIGLLRDYEQHGKSSGVSVQSKKPCRVLTRDDWQERIERIRDSIIFIDEGNDFVKSERFAEVVKNSSNYYVIITRENLYQLPYSVNSILKLKTTNRRKKTYIRSYPLYDRLNNPIEQITGSDLVITEDSNAGYELFLSITQSHDVACIPANGKSNVFSQIIDHVDEKILAIADGAAFGAEVDKIYQLMEEHPNKVTLYLPESFEWLILKSGILGAQTPVDILATPSTYIDSSLYFSWEQYFTDLLIQITSNTILRYNKRHLNPVYLQPANVAKFLDAIRD